jgi:hypothetical protein
MSDPAHALDPEAEVRRVRTLLVTETIDILVESLDMARDALWKGNSGPVAALEAIEPRLAAALERVRRLS